MKKALMILQENLRIKVNNDLQPILMSQNLQSVYLKIYITTLLTLLRLLYIIKFIRNMLYHLILFIFNDV